MYDMSQRPQLNQALFCAIKASRPKRFKHQQDLLHMQAWGTFEQPCDCRKDKKTEQFVPEDDEEDDPESLGPKCRFVRLGALALGQLVRWIMLRALPCAYFSGAFFFGRASACPGDELPSSDRKGNGPGFSTELAFLDGFKSLAGKCRECSGLECTRTKSSLANGTLAIVRLEQRQCDLFFRTRRTQHRAYPNLNRTSAVCAHFAHDGARRLAGEVSRATTVWRGPKSTPWLPHHSPNLARTMPLIAAAIQMTRTMTTRPAVSGSIDRNLQESRWSAPPPGPCLVCLRNDDYDG